MYKIKGYINSFNRNSKPIRDARGNTFYEQTEKGAFKRDIESNKNITLVIDHDDNRVIAQTKDKTLRLYEDNIGLRYEALIHQKDIDVLRDIQTKKFTGCSFKFFCRRSYNKELYKNKTVRVLSDVELSHVTLLKEPIYPAYIGSTVELE